MWLLALLFFASAASPQGMVLPEASLLLDTGANNSILSPQAAGLTTVQLRALRATQVGTGAEGDYIAREVDLRLDRRHWVNRRALVMDLSASKRMGALVDGFLGQDILREFSPVRIDFKNHAIEISGVSAAPRGRMSEDLHRDCSPLAEARGLHQFQQFLGDPHGIIRRVPHHVEAVP